MKLKNCKPAAIELESGCWEWLGNRHREGYGRIHVGGKWTQAHRWVYGEVPNGKELHHICQNKACVNPIHLVAVTRKEHKLLEPSTPFSCAAGLKKKSQQYCEHGHPFDEANTYHWRGHRYCRKCRADRQRRNYATREIRLECGSLA